MRHGKNDVARRLAITNTTQRCRIFVDRLNYRRKLGRVEDTWGDCLSPSLPAGRKGHYVSLMGSSQHKTETVPPLRCVVRLQSG